MDDLDAENPAAPFAFLPRRSEFFLFALFLLILVEASYLVSLPAVAGWLIDRAVNPKARGEFWNVLILFGDGTAAALLAGVLRDFVLSKFHAKTVAHIRDAMFQQMQHMPVEPGVGEEPGDAQSNSLVDKFANDLVTIEDASSMAVPWGLLPLVSSSLCTLSMLGISWRLGIFGLPLWPWILLASRRFAHSAAAAGDASAEAEEKVLGTVEEAWSAHALISALGLEDAGLKRFQKRSESLARKTAKAGWAAAMLERFTGTGTLAVQVGILVAGSLLLAGGRITAGALASELLLSMLLGNSLQYMAEFLPALANMMRAWSRIREGFAISGTDPGDSPNSRILPPLREDIVFSNVCYGPAGATEVLGVSMRIQRGTHVALVGPSDSGKSAMLKLLMRLGRPTSGFITFDGHDLQSVTRASLRAQIGFVPQHCDIFSGTVRENIHLGRPDGSLEAVDHAASLAGLDPLSPELPRGLETMIGEGGRQLSLETTQRLGLARALLGNPGILLLDEVSSQLDPVEEETFNRMLAQLAKGRTVVSATHRLSTFAKADKIYFFEGGTILEQGNHFELMAFNQAYSDLWRKQAGFRFSNDGRHVDVDALRLKQLPFLERLDLAMLADLAPYFGTENFIAGRDIVCQNDPGDRFYIIVRGRVDVWRMEEESKRTLRVATLQDGDYFGEMTLITGFPRTATVRTVTACTCISIERGQFSRLMDRDPELRRELSEVAVQRLRQSSIAVAESRR